MPNIGTSPDTQIGAATRRVLRCPIALHCLPPAHLRMSATSPLVIFSAACLSCIVYLPLLLRYLLPACHLKLYLNLIFAFILLSLPSPPCHLSQRPLKATSTMERPHPSLPPNTVFICHCCHLPHCLLSPSDTACCCSYQTPSLPLPPFAILSLSVTAATVLVVHCRPQTLPPAIATRCRSRQTPSLPLLPFVIFHPCVH
jgi:hypothetical protein